MVNSYRVSNNTDCSASVTTTSIDMSGGSNNIDGYITGNTNSTTIISHNSSGSRCNDISVVSFSHNSYASNSNGLKNSSFSGGSDSMIGCIGICSSKIISGCFCGCRVSICSVDDRNFSSCTSNSQKEDDIEMVHMHRLILQSINITHIQSFQNPFACCDVFDDLNVALKWSPGVPTILCFSHSKTLHVI